MIRFCRRQNEVSISEELYKGKQMNLKKKKKL